jgi:hypothetical protein
MWSALENVGAFDHSNDASRDRAYVAAILRDSLDAAEARVRAEAAAKITTVADEWDAESNGLVWTRSLMREHAAELRSIAAELSAPGGAK